MDKPVAGPGEPAKRGLVFPHATAAVEQRLPPAATWLKISWGRDGEAVCIAGSILDDREGARVISYRARRAGDRSGCCLLLLLRSCFPPHGVRIRGFSF